MPEEKPPFDGITPPHEDHEQEKIERLRRAMYSRELSDKLKDRERRELNEERSVVGDDWNRPERKMSGTLVAPMGMGITRTIFSWLLAAAAAFFIGAVGFFGYYFVLGGGSSPVSPGNIDIAVSGPLQVSSGEPAELQIAVTNRNRTSLELADLVVKYPAGTRSPEDLLTDLPNRRVPLGTIEPGGRRQGTVSAVFSGDEGARAKILVELEYRVQGSSAIFVAKTEYEVTFSSSPVSLSIEGNSETIAGQPIEMKVTVASNADTPVRDVLFTAGFPFGFVLTQAEPKTTGVGNVWTLGDLLPGQKKVITIRGTLAGETGDERVFRFSAGTRKDQKETTLSTVLADYSHSVSVSRPFLDMQVLVNREETSGSTVIAPGETVTVSVAYQNNLPTAIVDAVIVARLSGVAIDGTTVRSTDGFYRSTDNAMYWDKSTAEPLANIVAGGKGTVTFSFQVPNDETIQALRDPRLAITVHAAGKRVSETGVPESMQSSVLQTLRFASELEVQVQGLYYSNPFGSTGPLPPKAGTETTYAIVFSVTNTTNKIKNATLRAVLPPYVRWVGIYSPSNEKLVFNPNDSSMTWQIGDIEPGVGVNGAIPRQAAIAVGFTPSTSQVGQQPPLIRSVTLSGIDAATNAPVSKTAADVTTNISGDPGFNVGNATVVK